MPEQEIGVIGLGTIGGGLARNFASRGVRVAVYNRTHRRTEDFIADHGQEGDFLPAATIDELAHILKPPRAVAVLVNAGRPVDEVIAELAKALDKGDTIIDGGNSFFQDTQRRAAALEKVGFGFLGCGVSGGRRGRWADRASCPAGHFRCTPVSATWWPRSRRRSMGCLAARTAGPAGAGI